MTDQPTYENPFAGTGKDWDNIRDYIVGSLRRRFPKASEWDVDDATSEAISWLVDYWAQLEGNQQNSWNNWHAAKNWGVKVATKALKEENIHRRGEPSFDDLVRTDDLNFGQYAAVPHREIHYEPVDESESSDDDEAGLIRAEYLIEALAEEEWGGALSGYLNGLSTREEAELEGVDQSTVVRRRNAAMRKLRRWAVEQGLGVYA